MWIVFIEIKLFHELLVKLACLALPPVLHLNLIIRALFIFLGFIGAFWGL